MGHCMHVNVYKNVDRVISFRLFDFKVILESIKRSLYILCLNA